MNKSIFSKSFVLILTRYLILFISIFYFETTLAQKTLSLQPNQSEGKDALDLFDDRNAGNHPEFSAIAWTNNGIPVLVRSLIQFDLSELPSNASILNATLFLYGVDSEINEGHSTLDGSNSSFLKRVTSPWNEQTITWNNQPKTTSQNEVIFPASESENQNYEVDVTDFVVFILNNPDKNHGWMIKLQNESFYRSLIFGSSDWSNAEKRPKLVVKYECPEPSAAFSFFKDKLKVNFTNESEMADEFKWDFGDGNTSREENPEHIYSKPGEYNVKLIARNECGKDVITQSIIIHCPIPEPNFSVEIDALTVHFNNTSENADSFLWNFGDGNTSTSENPSHTYADSDSYTVTLLAKNECGESIKAKTINISCPNPDADFGYEMEGFTVKFDNRSMRANSYKWDFGDGNFSKESEPIYTYSNAGSYTVKLTAINECGEDIHTRTLEIEPVGIFSLENTSEGMKLFPSPGNDIVNIEFSMQVQPDDNLMVLSLEGKLIFTMPIETSNPIVSADVSRLAPGIYFFILSSGNRIIAREKLVIK